jgi:hypothetical protein
MKNKHYQIIFTWPNGKEEVRYTRPREDIELAKEVLNLKRMAKRHNYKCPYSIKEI